MNRTLLRFPGGDAHSPIACTYCPEMCRFSCPSAVASGNDAVTPCNKNSLLYRAERWSKQMMEVGELWPIYDCTGCGRCTQYCLYEVPVGKMLFEARKKYHWKKAQQIAVSLSDDEDRVGDLADELGDEKNALRRLKAYASKTVLEPRSLYFARKNQVSIDLSWAELLSQTVFSHSAFVKKLRQRLGDRRWLIHESVWLSRRLKQADRIHQWVQAAQAQGFDFLLPFEHGMDCKDCGGEGVYSRLFPEQATEMAQEIWQRDQYRVHGVFCLSQRCREHFERVLGQDIPVVALSDMM